MQEKAMDMTWLKHNIKSRDIVLVVLFALVLLGTQFYFKALTPPGQTFIGFFPNPVDSNSYKMWVVQFEKSIFVKDLYSLAEQKASYFNPFLFAEGLVVGMGVDYWIVENLFSIIFFWVMLIVLDKFASKYFSGEKKDAAVLLIVLFCSIDYITQSFVLLSAFYALSALHILLQLAVFYIAISEFSMRNLVAMFLVCCLLFLSHPFAIMLVPPVLAAYFGYAYAIGKKREDLMMLCSVSLATIACGIFLFISSAGVPGSAIWIWLRYPDTWTLFEIVYYAPAAVVCLFGVYELVKTRKIEPKHVLLVAWVVIVFGIFALSPLLDLLPLPMQVQKIAVALAAPLLILAFFSKRISKFLLDYRGFMAITFAVLLATNYVWMASYADADKYQYLNDGTLQLMREIKTDDLLNSTFSTDRISLISPYYTEKPSLPGHWCMTAGYEGYVNLSNSIVIQGNETDLEGYCSKTPGAAVLAERGDGLYAHLSGGNRTGVEVRGNSLLVRCSEFEKAERG